MRTAWKVSTAAAASGALLTAAAPSATPDTGGNRFVVRVSLADYHVHDARPDGPSWGDTSTHVARLFHQGERVGQEVSRCAVFRTPNKKRLGQQCVLTWTLRGRGQLTMQGVDTSRRPGETRAITGGTGEFRSASGVVKSVPGGDVRYQVRLTTN